LLKHLAAASKINCCVLSFLVFCLLVVIVIFFSKNR
jgi:hypothetical protein